MLYEVITHIFQGKDHQGRVTQSFAVDQFGFGADGTGKGLRVRRVGKADLDAQPGQGVAELVVGAAIEAVAGDDVVPGLAEGEKGQRLGTMTAACGKSRQAAFK